MSCSIDVKGIEQLYKRILPPFIISLLITCNWQLHFALYISLRPPHCTTINQKVQNLFQQSSCVLSSLLPFCQLWRFPLTQKMENVGCLLISSKKSFTPLCMLLSSLKVFQLDLRLKLTLALRFQNFSSISSLLQIS